METHDDQEPFHCIICLELVYKPIVHACGHLFCFWCVHRAMDGTSKSLCPLCRRPYMHFPRICEQLHNVLRKAVRDEYLVRAKEVQEEEAQGGIFSPQLDHEAVPQLDHKAPVQSGNPPPDTTMQETAPEAQTAERTSPVETEAMSSSDDQRSEPGSANLSHSSSGDATPPKELSPSQPETASDYDPSIKGKAPMPAEGEPEQGDEEMQGKAGKPGASNSGMDVTVSDLTCGSCSKLLYRPVVLNCGHMFCERCVDVSQSSDEDCTVTCPSCKANHPGLFPQVCLELHHYIDRVFPLEYAQRSLEIPLEERGPVNRPDAPPSELETSSKEESRKRAPQGPVHRAVGCDGCGMMPIVGRRFRCKDCPEAIGYDLCAKCHESGCVVGRFNQRHAPEHRMVEMPLPGRRSIARQFLDAMANRSGLNITDLRIIAHECDELEAMHLLQHVNSVRGDSGNGNGAEVQHTEEAAGSNNGDGLPDADGDGFHLEFPEDRDMSHDLAVYNGDGMEDFAGADDEEFETFSRDDEDIEFYRVVFHA